MPGVPEHALAVAAVLDSTEIASRLRRISDRVDRPRGDVPKKTFAYPCGSLNNGVISLIGATNTCR
jgi:hypothetical protein